MILKCCICGEDAHTVIGWKEGREVVKCAGCDLWYIRDIPANYYDMYRDSWYWHQRQLNVGHVPYMSDERYAHDYFLARTRLKKLRKHRESGTLLDVGCSNGAFVHRALVEGRSAWGIDIAASVDKIPRCQTMDFNSYDFSPGCKVTVDIVTMHDVIEHCIDFNSWFKQLNKITVPKALIVIDWPDFSCDEFIKEGIAWKHVRPIEHIYMIPPNKMINMVEGAGYKILEEDKPIPGKCVIYAEKQ